MEDEHARHDQFFESTMHCHEEDPIWNCTNYEYPKSNKGHYNTPVDVWAQSLIESNIQSLCLSCCRTDYEPYVLKMLSKPKSMITNTQFHIVFVLKEKSIKLPYHPISSRLCLISIISFL
ncbi:hypothetical protein KP509_17G079600 [Ceratopteris richardii]|uniref:Uncharacterized protein n=1 Tax=Ceratopteris richardii TaxID=49495 RepID=A0A8T2SZZ9_CERRI|nr:hypothetical protein KP509_17G079600 [Ceratopteris richardii]